MSSNDQQTENNYNLKLKHIVNEHASAIHNDSVGENVVSVVENVLKNNGGRNIYSNFR